MLPRKRTTCSGMKTRNCFGPHFWGTHLEAFVYEQPWLFKAAMQVQQLSASKKDKTLQFAPQLGGNLRVFRPNILHLWSDKVDFLLLDNSKKSRFICKFFCSVFYDFSPKKFPEYMYSIYIYIHTIKEGTSSMQIGVEVLCPWNSIQTSWRACYSQLENKSTLTANFKQKRSSKTTLSKK